MVYSIEYYTFLGETLQGEIGNYLYSGGCTYYSTYILQQLQLWHSALDQSWTTVQLWAGSREQSFALFVSAHTQGKSVGGN